MKDLKVMVGSFIEKNRRKGLKVKPDKSKMIVLGGKERLEREMCMDRAQLKQVLQYKYLGLIFR